MMIVTIMIVIIEEMITMIGVQLQDMIIEDVILGIDMIIVENLQEIIIEIKMV